MNEAFPGADDAEWAGVEPWLACGKEGLMYMDYLHEAGFSDSEAAGFIMTAAGLDPETIEVFIEGVARANGYRVPLA